MEFSFSYTSITNKVLLLDAMVKLTTSNYQSVLVNLGSS